MCNLSYHSYSFASGGSQVMKLGSSLLQPRCAIFTPTSLASFTIQRCYSCSISVPSRAFSASKRGFDVDFKRRLCLSTTQGALHGAKTSGARISIRHMSNGGLSNLFDPSPGMMQIRNVSGEGIELEDGMLFKSSCILLGGKAFLWKTPPISKDWRGWGEADFEIFETVVPKPGHYDHICDGAFTNNSVELLLLGTGKTLVLPPPAIRQYLNRIGVKVDIMDTVRLIVLLLPSSVTEHILREMQVPRSIC